MIYFPRASAIGNRYELLNTSDIKVNDEIII